MAKLSARGAHEVEKIYAGKPAVTGFDDTARWLFAYRSDGKVLMRLTRIGSRPVSGGYRVAGTASAKAQAELRTGPVTFDHEKVRVFLAYCAKRYGMRAE